MKKGQILEGYIERVDFPNKGFAVVEDGFWKFWSIHRKNVSRHVRILESVADALIRICRMKSRWR